MPIQNLIQIFTNTPFLDGCSAGTHPVMEVIKVREATNQKEMNYLCPLRSPLSAALFCPSNQKDDVT